MIRAEALACSAGHRQLLHAMDLRLEPGSCIALAGPNGAGKTTLLRLIAGEQSDSWQVQGQLLLDERPIAAWSAGQLAARRAFLRHRHVERTGLGCREVVLLGAFGHAITAQIRQRVDELLDRWLLQSLTTTCYDCLSGGERQRVHLARTQLQLSLNPNPRERIWLLDEPFNALDLPFQRLLREQLHQTARDGGLVVFSAHDLNMIVRTAGQVIGLRQGGMAYAGDVSGFARPEILGELFDTPFLVTGHPDLAGPLIIAE